MKPAIPCVRWAVVVECEGWGEEAVAAEWGAAAVRVVAAAVVRAVERREGSEINA